ncbi:MAG TPA: hypothetical protein VGT81_10910 [Casimicrobiaceae bacterium]|nr:hypothetical protein [Casimicrobiaceae bacterium]
MSEIDPELDATWRAASREQPPAALDDAIRAAARREVGAKPGRLRAAPRWLPFAAAATVAAIAVGIIQMTPPEEVTPATIPAATHTASDSARREAKPDTEKPSADRPERQAPSIAPAPETQRDAAKPTAKEQRRGAVDENDRDALARNRSEGLAGAPRKALQEKKVLASAQESSQRMEETERAQDSKQKTELAAASSAARPNPVVSTPPASVARNEPHPFPATPAPAESGATKVPPQMAAAAPPAAPASAAAPAPMIAERKLAAQSSATGALSANRAGKSADDIAGGGMSNVEPAPAQNANALDKRKADMADKATLERRKDSAPLAPDEWIKRIRRLIAEGKNEDAARELLAFRREYRERSESLLPSDLRAFKP